MMGKQDRQLKMIIIDIGQLVPEGHLLKKIEKLIDFDFIYKESSAYYSQTGRNSIDPVLLVKILLIGYLYGIKSERRLEQEINMNIAYRYFCGLDFDKNAPDHSTFSQNRRRRFKDASIFREIFNRILVQLVEKGLVTGKNVVSDGTFIPANVAWSNRYETTKEIERSSISYLEELD
ncbi:MAG: transposase, partial [Cytophagaceae bacterium]|nr:transposase [Cytophagaceae bacterium]